MHRVGLRRAVDVAEWVAGSDDESLVIQEVNEEEDPDNVMGGMPNAGEIVVRQHFGGTSLGEAETDHRSVSGQNDEYAAEEDRHFNSNDAVDAKPINEQVLNTTSSGSSGREPLSGNTAGEELPPKQHHGVDRRSETADLIVAGQENSSLPKVEDETEAKIIVSDRDLADVCESSNRISPEDGNDNGNTNGDGHETIRPMQLVKHRKVRAVNRSSETRSATGEIPSPLHTSRMPSFGSGLVPPTMGNGLLKPLLWSHHQE